MREVGSSGVLTWHIRTNPSGPKKQSRPALPDLQRGKVGVKGDEGGAIESRTTNFSNLGLVPRLQSVVRVNGKWTCFSSLQTTQRAQSTSHIHTYTHANGTAIQSNFGFSVLLKDTSTCSWCQGSNHDLLIIGQPGPRTDMALSLKRSSESTNQLYSYQDMHVPTLSYINTCRASSLINILLFLSGGGGSITDSSSLFVSNVSPWLSFASSA